MSPPALQPPLAPHYPTSCPASPVMGSACFPSPTLHPAPTGTSPSRCAQLLALLRGSYLSHLSAFADAVPTTWNDPAPLNYCILSCDLFLDAFSIPSTHATSYWVRGLSRTLHSTQHSLALSGRTALLRSRPPGCELSPAGQLCPTWLSAPATRLRAWHARQAQGRTALQNESWERHALLPTAQLLASRLGAPTIFISSPCRAEACRAGSQTQSVRPARRSEDTGWRLPKGPGSGREGSSSSKLLLLREELPHDLGRRAAGSEPRGTAGTDSLPGDSPLGSGPSFATFLLCDLEQVTILPSAKWLGV